MNEYLKNLALNEKPKIELLSNEAKRDYKLGLFILSTCISEDFFDLDKLPRERFEKDGYFYNIPYFDDEVLSTIGNKSDLIVIYKVENKTSYCPLRMEVQVIDSENYKVVLCDQTGERTMKYDLIERVGKEIFVDTSNLKNQTLKSLVEKTEKGQLNA